MTRHRDDPVIRPGTIIITLILMGISTLFAGLCAAYLYTMIGAGIEAPHPPLLFLINIPVLYSATVFLKKSLHAFDESLFKGMLKYQALCLFLTAVFITLQIIGWSQFFQQIPMSASQSRSFLFVLSGLHLLHVIAGLPFLITFMWRSKGVINQLYQDNSAFRVYLKGIVRYWNYLDVLWVLLVIILSFGFILKWL